MLKRSGSRAPVTVITHAEPSHAEQLRSRQKRYLIMMGTRAVCIVLAAVAYSQRLFWVLPVCVVGMVALPWMAVLIANDRPPVKAQRGGRRLRTEKPQRAIEAPPPDRVIDL